MHKILAFIFLQTCFMNLNFAGDLAVTGLVGGHVTETNDAIIIEGATFVNNGNNAPAISVRSESGKNIIVSNVRVLSNNQKIHSNTSQSGVILIDNQNSKTKVLMRGVNVVSRNADISSQSTGKDVCAAVICSNAGSYDSYSSLSVGASGNTNISAVQGVRPDYRKMLQH